ASDLCALRQAVTANVEGEGLAALRAVRLDIANRWRSMNRRDQKRQAGESPNATQARMPVPPLPAILHLQHLYFCDTTAFSSGTGTNSLSILPLRSKIRTVPSKPAAMRRWPSG